MENTEVEVKYLENILHPLLLHPNDLEINRSVDERGIYIVVKVNQADMGRVIGKQGQTAQAVRSLMHQFGGMHQKLISVKIDEPIGSTRRFRNDSIRDKDLLN